VERLDLRRGEGERIDEALRALAIARDEAQRHRARLAGFRQSQREIGNDESVKAFGRCGKRDRAPFGKAADGMAEPAGGRDELVHGRRASLAKASRGARRSRANNGVS